MSDAMELTKIQADSGQTVLRAFLLINGAAAVALIAFIGTIATAKQTTLSAEQIQGVAGSLSWFLAGVFLVGLAYGFTYLANTLNLIQMEGLWGRIGPGLMFLAILAGVGSLLSFGLGATAAVSSFVGSA